jgi:hypothetical protein
MDKQQDGEKTTDDLKLVYIEWEDSCAPKQDGSI